MGSESYRTNPRDWLEPWCWAMLRLWRLSQGGMGAGHLPEAGGTMDQPTKMIEAFALMSAFEAELQASTQPGTISRTDIEDIRAGIDRALDLYPDGMATGPLLAAIQKSRNKEA